MKNTKTYGDLKAFLGTLTPEQLAMPVGWTGEDRGGTVKEFEVLAEDHVNPSGDGMEPVSSYAPGEIEGEPVVARKGQPLLVVD